jgi:hypothetical protein
VSRLYPERLRSPLGRRSNAASWLIVRDVGQRVEHDIRALSRAASAFIAEGTHRLSTLLTGDVPHDIYCVLSIPLAGGAIDEHAAQSTVARHEARFFGPAQARPDPDGFVPGPFNQAVPGLLGAPAGRHGPARQRTAGTDRPGTGSGIASAPAGTDPTQATLRLLSLTLSRSRSRSRPRPLRRSSCSAAHRLTVGRRRSLCRIFVTGPLPCGAPLQTPALHR